MGKQTRLSDEVHRFATSVKFYSGIAIEDFCSEMIKEASTSPILEKVLMNFLLDRKKVDYVLKKLLVT